MNTSFEPLAGRLLEHRANRAPGGSYQGTAFYSQREACSASRVPLYAQSQSKTAFGTGCARDRVGEVRASSSGSASSHSESCVVTSGLERLLRKSCLKSARKLTTTAAVDIDSYMVESKRPQK